MPSSLSIFSFPAPTASLSNDEALDTNLFNLLSFLAEVFLNCIVCETSVPINSNSFAAACSAGAKAPAEIIPVNINACIFFLLILAPLFLIIYYVYILKRNFILFLCCTFYQSNYSKSYCFYKFHLYKYSIKKPKPFTTFFYLLSYIYTILDNF